MFEKINDALSFRYDTEKVLIEPWGENAIRVRATKGQVFDDNNWALLSPEKTKPIINIIDEKAELINGKVRVEISKAGKIEIYKSSGEKIIEEYARNRRDICHPKCSALEIEAREFKPIVGSDNYHLTMRFETLDQDEKIYGMGQYQQPYLNLKGLDIELAHRNSQASVPFAISSNGFGFLWNNPSVGRAVFGNNITTYEAYSTRVLDYFLIVGDTPAEIIKGYAKATGTVPEMPEYGLGFWQSKLRYQTQDELINVAREYKKRHIPLDVIVVDFFHWDKQGDWKFDKTYWPEPEKMIREINDMGTEVMVSIWPTVSPESENYQEMLEKGLLINTERGIRASMNFQGETIHFDATNPEARDYIWSRAKENYYKKGVKIFWLDEAEPEYTVYDFDNYRYHLGANVEVGNIYPNCYARAFYDGMKKEGQKNVVNLLRCTWAGGQRYGALVWSGDIASSFDSMRNQIVAGLNMGIAGIPWWTTDIGGFHGGNPDDPEFRELFARWFAWGAFCPVMRLHGDREPRQPQQGVTGGATCCSGADNEIWSYGDEVYEICKKYIGIREKLRPYLRKLMIEAHTDGAPIMRTMFYEFPEDEECWDIDFEYMLGPDILVAPITYANANSRIVYLPAGCQWYEYETGLNYEGGQAIEVLAPLDVIPIFFRGKDNNILAD
ncbi:MAG: family 31 glucosidase [Pseudobutyrivibrio sp.]|jgi:alpha-D-xyloside xylohydrolase|uniref:glycoside hydrolase family 31 protein n=1 Tax=Pseudobutyrivibrio sp. TaxID=2014367 RepID=UPI0025F7C876|nr:TIM-barrel domain-containing protein [Pseudobutyrivibrio sp.]MBE5904133.1 family 31 glucosidase [Pseudobutyrivibrio sp.]